jgi:two-component system, LytTR family, sensor kinase
MRAGGLYGTRRWVAIGSVCWTVLAVGYILSMGLRNVSYGHPFIPAWWSITNPLLMTAVGAALTPLALVALHRVPAVAEQRSRAVLMYVALGIAYWLVWALVVAGLGAVGLIRPPGLNLTRTVVFMAYISLGAFAVLVMLHETIRSLRQARERELEAARLQAELSEAQAAALRARLNPDFLFRTLETAAEVMERNARAARAVLADLGALLRASLGQNGSDLTTYQDELELLQRYLDIRRARPGERLRVEMGAEPVTAACRLPPLVLQPVMEALIPDGGLPRADTLVVTAHAGRVGSELRIRLAVSGADVGPAGFVPVDGGLGSTRARLRAVYGDAASITLVEGRVAGVEVEIRVPQTDEEGAHER